jgi:RNA polymerase sigma-70 factor (ECF subfamily)
MMNNTTHTWKSASQASATARTPVYSDAEITELLCQGDCGAFTALYDRYATLAYALALRLLQDPGQAEDVVQDVLLSLWERPDRFDPTQGTLRTWVLSATHHRAVDRIRRRVSHPQTSLDAFQSTSSFSGDRERVLADILVASDEMDPAISAEQHERAVAVRHALTLLPLAQRDALLLAYFAGLTHQQIAAELGEPLGTIKTRIRLGLIKLREMLAQFDEVGARTAQHMAPPPPTSAS